MNRPSRSISGERIFGCGGRRKRSGRMICGALRSSTSRSFSASPHQQERAVLQITQAAVDELGRGRGRAGCQIALLDQQHAQAPAGGVAGDAGAVDAAADDGKVEIGHRCPPDARNSASMTRGPRPRAPSRNARKMAANPYIKEWPAQR